MKSEQSETRKGARPWRMETEIKNVKVTIDIYIFFFHRDVKEQSDVQVPRGTKKIKRTATER